LVALLHRRTHGAVLAIDWQEPVMTAALDTAIHCPH